MCKSRVVPKIEMWSVENSFPGRALQARGKGEALGIHCCSSQLLLARNDSTNRSGVFFLRQSYSIAQARLRHKIIPLPQPSES